MSGVTGPIPDPEAPTTRAIGSDGELLGGVFLLSRIGDPEAPTLEELAGAEHIGWADMNRPQT